MTPRLRFSLFIHQLSDGCLRRTALAAVAVLGISGCSNEEAAVSLADAADTVFVSGKVHTVNATNQVAQALAIKDGKIVAVGDNGAVKTFIGSGTKVIDLQGKVLMPGIVDGHTHPLAGGKLLTSCSLEYKSLTVDEVLERITACLEDEKDAPVDKWLDVTGWFRQAMKPDGTDLTAKILDRLPTDRPVVVAANDMHSTAVNSKVLALANITRDTPAPTTGKLARDESGDPTGILVDGARGLLEGAKPEMSPEEEAEQNLHYAAAAVKELNKQGVTSILHALANEKSVQAFSTLRKDGLLTVRPEFAVFIPPTERDNLEQSVSNVLAIRERYNAPGSAELPGISVSTVKVAVDGVIQMPAQNGAMIEPYLHNVGTHTHPDWQPSDNWGSLYMPESNLTELTNALAANKLNIHMHTTGDMAVKTALNAVASTREKYPGADFRPALAHDEMVDPADYPRFKALNATPVLSLQWGKRAPDTIESVKPYIGDERFPYLETAGKFEQAGVRVAFGSDWPVDPLDEWYAMKVGVTRTNRSDAGEEYQGRLGDDPGLTVEQAIRAFTLNAAYTVNKDDIVGSLEVGKYADVIVIDRDIASIDPMEISGTEVLLTLLGGKEVYRSPNYPAQ